MKRSLMTGWLMAGLVGVVALAASDAHACGGDWEAPPVNPFPIGVSMAEKQLQEGHMVSAAATVVRMYPHIRTLSAKNGPLVERALHVLAVATARESGVLAMDRELPASLRGTWSSDAEPARQDRLAWAATTLRALSEVKKDDPTIQGELGEALARTPDGKAEAAKLLGDLADRDLLGSAEAYATLARLRADAGDAAGRDAARKRCEAMAKDAHVCEADAEVAG